ncbi:MAG: prepilin-type N-terminal cleavage/methylation domain-containing protein [Candidatus Doudnabacteria bacterium]|nr:prepilin-type N-terminal cleavage/methylation domain-containing protein [Candidatus Doudnabacteria bacterium]
MKFANCKKRINRGFTMIELLIVIAVLGVLAVAVLATINPIEQINRGRDTGSRGDTEQLLSAIDRYNANKCLWPWQDAATDDPALVWMTVTAAAPASPNGCAMLGLLSTTADPACPGTADERCAGTPPADYPANACGACPVSLGRHTSCVCLP